MKSLLTSLTSLFIIFAGLFFPSPTIGELMTNVGSFALVCALANTIALRIVFSRLILNRFGEFKASIKLFIMREFFSLETVEEMLTSRGGEILFDFSHLDECLDYDELYEATAEAIIESPVGGMIKLVGGQSRLEPLRNVFKNKIRKLIIEYSHSKTVRDKLIASTDSKAMAKNLIMKIEQVVDIHLRDLTPGKVRDLVHDMLSVPLGWLVVWAGILGGIMGAVTTFIF